MESYSAVKKEWNTVTCDNLGESGQLYAIWKNADTEDHILYDFIYVKCPQQVNPWRENVDWWWLGDASREEFRVTTGGCEVSFSVR